jgi:L-2-hydroxyglutarate oxidase LhgO
VIATGNDQVEYLDRLHMHTQHPALEDQVPTYFLGAEETLRMEPDLAPWIKAAMISTETGIVDSHALMESLEREIEEEGGEGLIVRGTRVVRVDPDPKGEGWVVQMETGWSKEHDHQGETEAVLAKVVVNAAGLGAAHIINPLLPASQRTKMWLSKGPWLLTCGS